MIRQKYIDRISPFMGITLIKVLSGQRRVGKSVLLRTIADKIKEEQPETQIMFIDVEKYEFDFLKTYVDLMEYIKINKVSDKIALFIDEIQGITSFEKALRSLYSNPDFDIYISGSNANLMSGEMGTFLSGRYIEFEIFPLTYVEYLAIYNYEDSEKIFYKFIQFGGLPGLSELPDVDNIKFEYLRNIYTSILYKDVIQRYNIRNHNFLENLVFFTANNIGSLLSANKISVYLKSQNQKIATNLVIEYLDSLCNALIIRKVNRYNIEGKKLFEVGQKYYFEDLGIRNAIIGYKIEEVQKYFENIVFNHLKANQYDVKVGYLGSNEIDFVATKNNEKKYIQVCFKLDSQSTIQREFGNLLAINDNYEKMVVSSDNIYASNTYEGVKHYNIREFLLNFE